MILVHNFHKRIALKMCPAGDKMSTLVFDFQFLYNRGGWYFIIFYNPGGVSVGVVGLWGRIRGENVGMEVLI